MAPAGGSPPLSASPLSPWAPSILKGPDGSVFAVAWRRPPTMVAPNDQSQLMVALIVA